MDLQRGVRNEREHALREAVEQRPRRRGLFLRPGRRPAEQGGARLQQARESGVAVVGMAEVVQAQPAAAGLVLVRRADPPPGGADPVGAEPFFLPRLDGAMHRQDHLRPVGEQQAAAGVEPGGLQPGDLVEQGFGVHHAAVPDDGADAGVEDRGRQEMQDELAPVHHHGVAGVVPAAEADHRVEVRGQQVHELPLPLVAPLGADDRDAGHVGSPRVADGRSGAGAGRRRGSPRYSRPSSARISSSRRGGVRSGWNPRCRFRTSPLRSVR